MREDRHAGWTLVPNPKSLEPATARGDGEDRVSGLVEELEKLGAHTYDGKSYVEESPHSKFARAFARDLVGKSFFGKEWFQMQSRLIRPHTPPPVVFIDDFADIETRMLSHFGFGKSLDVAAMDFGYTPDIGMIRMGRAYNFAKDYSFGWVRPLPFTDPPPRPDWLLDPPGPSSVSALLASTARVAPYVPPAPPTPRTYVWDQPTTRPRTGWDARKKEEPPPALYNPCREIPCSYSTTRYVRYDILNDDNVVKHVSAVARQINKTLKEKLFKALYYGDV